MRFEGLLARHVRGFWGTSYSFGLKLFDQYLLRRLSHSPLNAVVLADRDKVSEIWENIPDNDHYLARQVGRRYLLRGLKPAGGGAFHPKTYLFARPDGATLVVGSGNLTPGGIDRGHEVFTTFDAERDQDLPSMRAWGAWMSRLVGEQDDELLYERWRALRESCPWMLGGGGTASFLVNDERTMLDQMGDWLPNAVAELHVTAPFFDRDALALRTILAAWDPAKLVLYLGAGANVHGPSLAATLNAARGVELKRYEPHTFVHAKLIGAIGTDESGVLLLGSPNLSRAAMTLTCAGDEPRGNCETAVLRKGSADQVVAVFEGSGLKLAELSSESLLELHFTQDRAAAPRPLLLRTAWWRDDGRIVVECSGAQPRPAETSLAWTEDGRAAALDETGATVDRLDERDPLPLIVWLVDAEGVSVSNRVAVDDPAALRETLFGSERRREFRPLELEGFDAAPLARIVLWAHDKFIFDPDETPAFRRAQDAAGEDASAEDVGDFWERYAREELEYDPRSQTYRPLTPGGGGAGGPIEELLRELQTLLHAAPSAPHPLLRALSLEPEGEEGEDDGGRRGSPWSMEARQRIRAYHLLTRWSNAVADPRHMMLSPDAPVLNYQTLLGLILAAWFHQALDRKHLRRLLLTLLDAFIGADEGRGFLGRIGEKERTAALARLDPFAMEIAAGLTAIALESGWQHDIYEWQPVLRRGLAFDVLLCGEWSGRVVERLDGKTVAVADIATLLQKRIEWVDDKTWCKRLADELELESVSLNLHRRAKVRAAVTVKGAGDPLRDGRLLTVARRAVEFKRLPAVAVLVGGGAVLIFEPDRQNARALVGDSTFSASTPVTGARLEEVERQGGSWADLLDTAAAA